MTHVFNTYRFTLLSDEKQLNILDGRKADKDKAFIALNPQMQDGDLLIALHEFQKILNSAIQSIEDDG
ncbi:MAG: hypothetical protein JKY11_07380 [Alphaproteobacteria bacterium]|nr:hypothetical protein [Alphaproteobacteria bacterium]